MCSNSPNIIVPFSCLSYNLRHSIKSSNDPKSFDFFTSAAKKKNYHMIIIAGVLSINHIVSCWHKSSVQYGVDVVR